MTTRRRRALASAVTSVAVAALCALLSANVEGAQRTVLIVLTVGWLVLAATFVATALRTTEPAAAAALEEGTDDAA
jgi:fatty acid desaturase